MFACADAGAPSRKLRQVKVPIVSNDECEEHIGAVFTPNMLCAGGVANKGACVGDSGGPLVCRDKQGDGGKWFQKGIVSRGKGCGEEHYPTVYANVFALTDWIREKTGSKCRLSARVYQTASHAKNENAGYCCRCTAWSACLCICRYVC